MTTVPAAGRRSLQVPGGPGTDSRDSYCIRVHSIQMQAGPCEQVKGLAQLYLTDTVTAKLHMCLTYTP